ncbi:hypothetical protein [Elioraea sp.]|uniref:hypothetical protein n=1 Tax=Elioraea sp. TaxID=2185103 RepID=UPI0025B9E2BF|nr:hypothetical protein [Elioraea sp.]
MLDFIENTTSVMEQVGRDEAIAQYASVRRALQLTEAPETLTQEETILRFLVYANPILLQKAHTAIDIFQARCEKLFGTTADWD